jgi:IS5 family transposase
LAITSRQTRTRKHEILEEVKSVLLWGVFVKIVEPQCPKAKTGQPPFGIESMMRIQYL